jgi:cation:H+ antiporter
LSSSEQSVGPRIELTPLHQRVATAAAFTIPGLLVRLTGGTAPHPLQLLAYGAAVVAGAFMLAWATEAAQEDIGHGIVIAVVAFVAILPEYVVEVHYAFTGQAQYVTANLTGASRLLLGCAVALPAVVGMLRGRGRGAHIGHVALAPAHRLELAILGLGGLWALRGVLRGELTSFDSVVLVGLYVLYLRRVATIGGDNSPPVGVAAQLAQLPAAQRKRWAGGLMLYAAAVILVTAVPFGDAVLGTGALVGIEPYLLLQWIVPIATEAPELVVAFVLLTHGRGGQSLAVLLAGAVSQYTLALGTLPAVYSLGAGVGPLPLPARERIELFLTIGVALYAIASLVMLRLSRADSGMMLALFGAQFLLPSTYTRLAFALVFWVVAIDVLAAERRQLRPLLEALRPAADAEGRRGAMRRNAADKLRP